MKRLLPFLCLIFSAHFALSQQVNPVTSKILPFAGTSTTINSLQQLPQNAQYLVPFAFQTVTPSAPIEERRHVNWWWWLIGVVLVIAGGVLLYFLIKKDPRHDVN